MPTDSDHRTLTTLLDRLIPAVDDLPAAGAMGLGDDVAAIAGQHGRYAAALAGCLAALPAGFALLDGDRQDAAIRAVEQSAAGDFTVLLKAVYLAYYSRPEVHRRIGWRGGPLQPAGFTLEPFDESVLAMIRQRKPFWREAPE
jgi:hypothetical protein